MNVYLLDYIDLLKQTKTPKNTYFTEFWKRWWNQIWIYLNFEKLMETFRCYKIGFFLTNIGVFVLIRIVSLCRISKWPRLDWKMQKIVHFGNLSWNNGQIQWIWCLSRNKLFLTMWEVKFATKVCNIMNYSPNTPTLMFNWCINCFNCKLHLQFVSLLFLKLL